ncbi:MAG TPA: dipeptide ABC transporter ATP-binding protein [Steroidobacteraceae bacterium]|nr:dipeptide ABC transporter ATP-binding protein [Steroidobacteraceae bacterium]
MSAVIVSASAAQPESAAVLSLSQLSVSFDTPTGKVNAAEEVSLTVRRGECLGVVGESGAGKSQTFLAVMGLLPANGAVRGSARFGDTELLTLTPAALDRVRGSGIAMVFQDPMTSLTPHLTVGAQLSEVLMRHRSLGRAAARAAALALLERVQVSDPARRLGQYPHELSGGMRQRAMIAIALAGEPKLLIADEPTTSLDVTIQAQILALLADLKRERGMALVLITHDLGAVAGVADRVAVMHRGRVVEEGPAAAVLKFPQQPYTRALLEQARRPELGPGALLTAGETSVPQGAAGAAGAVGAGGAAGEAGVSAGPAALSVSNLSVRYGVRSGWIAREQQLAAVTDVSLELRAGDSLGIVGESGSGKSTLVRAVVQLLPAITGRVVWMGQSLAQLPPRELRALRRSFQIIFQDPLGSLDPRMTVGESVAEPLRVHVPALAATERRAAVTTALERVGLAATLTDRYPHELSGGQAQRVGIARAMVLEPQLLVCDEPLSSLDAPTQQQIVSLLGQLRQGSGVALLFVSHNLALVRQLCERVLVLYLGRMMEHAPVAQLYAHPRHPYTRELLASIPSADPDVQPARLALVRPGEPPSPLAPPSGCAYRTRCPHAIPLCSQQIPAWDEPAAAQRVACHRWRELL